MRVGDTDSWKHMVLASGPAPAWLRGDAPSVDVVMSSRARLARNLRGHRFVTTASDDELKAIEGKVIGAMRATSGDVEIFRRLSDSERAYLINCRLLSPDFDTSLPHRSLILDSTRSLSLMVNEEDHLRLQAITAGWSPQNAEIQAQRAMALLAQNLEFAQTEGAGFLTTSPSNLGSAARSSALFHLIGLSASKKIVRVLNAVKGQRVIIRGLFGERSRPIGSFFQVSMTAQLQAEFVGACEYLMGEERAARSAIDSERVHALAQRAIMYVVTRREVSYRDSLEVLAHVRWAASIGLPGYPESARGVDRWFINIESRTHLEESRTSRNRARQLRQFLEPLLEKA